MSYKISVRHLAISNYPYIEEYLQDMARQGWLLHRIRLDNIFIFKRSQPREMEFFIKPYERETFLNRRTREESKEMEEEYKDLGWNYSSKTYNFLIYYGEAGSLASKKEELREGFRSIERMASRQIKVFIFPLLVFMFLCWQIFKDLDRLVLYRDILVQIVILVLPLGLLSILLDMGQNWRFLRASRRNFQAGQPLEYRKGSYRLLGLVNSLIFFLAFLTIVTILGQVIIFKDSTSLRTLLPPIIGVGIGLLFRFLIKPRKISNELKTGLLLIAVLVAFGLVSGKILEDPNPMGDISRLDREAYKVLLVSDFIPNPVNEEGRMVRRMSPLVPDSYKMTVSSEEAYMYTDYSRAIKESLAQDLFQAHIGQEEKFLVWLNKNNLRHHFQEGRYKFHPGAPDLIISEEEFNRLKRLEIKEAIGKALDLGIARSLVPADEALWGVDQAYYLSQDKRRIVLRQGKEVFALSGQDFSQEKIRELTKEILDLAR